MNTKRIYNSKEKLVEILNDQSVLVNFTIANRTLNINIKSSFDDELLVQLEDFEPDEFFSEIMHESFFIIMKKIEAKNRGAEEYITPLLVFLDSILIEALLVSEEYYKEMDKEIISIMQRSYYLNIPVKNNGVTYESFESSNSMI